MAEMLIRVVDKVNDDPLLDAQCTKRHDVIAVMPDGHPWSRAELAGDPWVVVKVPGAAVDQLSAFLAADHPDPHSNSLGNRRAFRFDLDAHDGKPLKLADALRKKVARPKRLDHRVLGPAPRVLGEALH